MYFGKIANFRNLREENSSQIPAQWIYRSIIVAFKLSSAKQITLNKCRLYIDLELLCIKTTTIIIIIIIKHFFMK